jgi:hypothetical protein
MDYLAKVEVIKDENTKSRARFDEEWNHMMRRVGSDDSLFFTKKRPTRPDTIFDFEDWIDR